MFRASPILQSPGRILGARLASSRPSAIIRRPLCRRDVTRKTIRLASSSNQPPKPPPGNEDIAHKKLESHPEEVSTTSSVRSVLEPTQEGGAPKEVGSVDSSLKHDIVRKIRVYLPEHWKANAMLGCRQRRIPSRYSPPRISYSGSHRHSALPGHLDIDRILGLEPQQRGPDRQCTIRQHPVGPRIGQASPRSHRAATARIRRRDHLLPRCHPLGIYIYISFRRWKKQKH